jgi:hypothetical protein
MEHIGQSSKKSGQINKFKIVFGLPALSRTGESLKRKWRHFELAHLI